MPMCMKRRDFLCHCWVFFALVSFHFFLCPAVFSHLLFSYLAFVDIPISFLSMFICAPWFVVVRGSEISFIVLLSH